MHIKKLSYIITFLVLINSIYAINVIEIGNDARADDIELYQVNLLYLSGSSACVEDWTCTAWVDCVGGSQTRTCTDSNSCGTETSKPAESQSCTDESGSGSSGSSSGSYVSTCEQGEIINLCNCGGQNYNSGFCIDSGWYSSDPRQDEEVIIDEAEIVVSPTIQDYNFTIDMEKYAYETNEDIYMEVRTYLNGQLYKAKNVFVEIKIDDVIYKQILLDNTGIGIYEYNLQDKLTKGTYDFIFTARFEDTIINQTKQVKISNNPFLANVLRSPSGQIKPSIYYAITVFAIILLIFVTIIFKRKKVQ